MNKKDLIKQLHNLNRDITPDAGWKAGNRDILVSQLKAQTGNDNEQLEHKISWQGLLAKRFFAAAYKPVGAMILIIGIVFGGYTMTVGATKNSLPGDFLYPIKLTGERMQVNLAGDNDEKKANLEIKFAERRLDEMKQVVAQDGNNANKKENIQVSLKKYQESINNVKSSLSKLEKTDSETALKVAKLVDEKSQNYVDILKTQQENSPEISKVSNTDDAISASKAMAEKALDMIINEYKAGSKEVTIDMVIQGLEKKLKDLNAGLDQGSQNLDTIIVNIAKAKELDAAAKAKADKEAAVAAKAEATAKPVEPCTDCSSGANETATNNNSNVNTNTNTNANTNVNTAPAQTPTPIEAPVVEVLPVPEVAKARLGEIKNLLIQANAYLSTKEVLWSYARMKDAQDILVLINKVIEANKQYLAEPKLETPEPAGEETTVTNTNVNAAPADESAK